MKTTYTDMIVWEDQASGGAGATLLKRLAALRQSKNAAFGRPAAQGLLAVVANPEASRAVRIAAIAASTDIDALIAVATGDAPMFARSNALSRIDALCFGKPLTQDQLTRLVPCLDEKELVAFTVVLMDVGDYPWPAQCSAATVNALCAAMYACTGIHESVLLEDAFAYLVHSRQDLGADLYACAPEKFVADVGYVPVPAVHWTPLDLPRKDNVA